MSMPSSPKADPKVYISGVGADLPDHSVTNETLAKLTGIDPEWIQSRTGIARRYLSKAGDRTSNLASRAAREALAQAGLAPSDIGLLMVASSFPDTFPPNSTAAVVKRKLGLVNAHIVDINTPLSGFLYALRYARDSIANGTVDAALVVGAESFSSASDLNDRRTCYLFSDGAGALVLTKKKGFATVGGVTIGNGSHQEQVDWCETVDEREAFTLYGKEIPGLDEALSRALDRVLGKKAPATTMHVLSQQLTHRSEPEVRPGVNVFDGFADCAYLLSASLPISLYHLLRWGECNARDRAMLFSTDGKGAWCASLVELLQMPAWAGAAPSPRAELPQPRDALPERRELFTCSKDDAARMLESEARRADPARGALVCLGFRMTYGGTQSKELRQSVEKETRTILTGNTRATDSLLRLEGAASYAVVLREVDLSDAQRLCSRLRGLLEDVDLAGELSVTVDSRVSAHSAEKSPASFAKDVLSGLTAAR
jgi:3-oxoacyl-[acyl-carrier-protein] synthase III